MISPSKQNQFSLRFLDWDKKIPKAKGGKPRNVVRVATSNNIVVIATSNCTIIRWKLLDSTKEPEEIEISNKAEEVIENVFLDFDGHHSIISMKNGDAYYLHSKSTKAKKLNKVQGTIECVAFDRHHTTESSTKSFLAGTSTGFIYEIYIDSSGKEKVNQVVYQIEQPIAISSIYFETVSQGESTADSVFQNNVAGNRSVAGDSRYFIMFATTTPTRMYHFVGGPTFQQLFTDYVQSGMNSFTELPGEIKKVELHCYSKKKNGRAQNFALMTGVGIYYGSMLGMSSGSENLLVEAHLMPYPESTRTDQDHDHNLRFQSKPFSMSVSEYHFLVLRSDRLQVISTLNGDLVQEEIIRSVDGIPVGIVRDSVKSSNLLFTSNNLFQISVGEEDRDIWSIYLSKALKTGEDALFDSAFEFSKTKEQKQIVMQERAEYYVKSSQWDKAAGYFAKSGLKFEDVAIKLLVACDGNSMKGNDTSVDYSTLKLTNINSAKYLNPIKVYLLETLQNLPPTSKSQKTMLCIWVCEIILHQLQASHLNKDLLEKEITAEFQAFIRGNRQHFDINTVLNLIISRNQRQLLLFFVKMMGDYYRVICTLMSERRYSEALTVLQDAPMEKVGSFIYKVTPMLMEVEPEKTTNMLLNKNNLSINALLPTILHYTSSLDTREETEGDENFAIKFFEELLLRASINLEPFQEGDDALARNGVDVSVWMNSSIEPVAIQMIVWLLAKYDLLEDKLVSLLRKLYELQNSNLLSEVVSVDADFIMRQCRTHKRMKSSIYALLLLKNPIQAVSEALKVDITIAKSIASKYSDMTIRRSLWLEIAQYVVETESDMKKAVTLVHESKNTLQIEDLLPLLPDFTEIDHFKDEICRSLEDYTTCIHTVKAEMLQLADSVDSTVNELEVMKTRAYSTVSHSQRCDFCMEMLLGNQFYLFPCSHGFHTDCLMQNALKSLNASQLNEIRKIEESLKSTALKLKENDPRLKAQHEALQQELDDIIAADCPLCGYTIIKQLSVSMLADIDKTEVQSWLL